MRKTDAGVTVDGTAVLSGGDDARLYRLHLEAHAGELRFTTDFLAATISHVE